MVIPCYTETYLSCSCGFAFEAGHEVSSVRVAVRLVAAQHRLPLARCCCFFGCRCGVGVSGVTGGLRFCGRALFSGGGFGQRVEDRWLLHIYTNNRNVSDTIMLIAYKISILYFCSILDSSLK